jgi:TPR repeat protein
LHNAPTFFISNSSKDKHAQTDRSGQKNEYHAIAYGNGQDVAQNEAEALNWFRKAAAQGTEKAIEVLRMSGIR